MPLAAREATPEYMQVNSAISTLTGNSQQEQHSVSLLLSIQLINNVVQAYNNQVDCLNSYCLPLLGCIHRRSEWIVQCGEIKQPPPTVTNCDTQCHVCDETQSKTFLPIIFSGSFAFLKSARFGAVLERLVWKVERLLWLVWRPMTMSASVC